MRIPAFTTVACIVLANATALAQGGPTRHYVNARFGFSADIPAGFVADDPPANGDGLIFHSPDRAVEVTASAIGNAGEESLAQFLAYTDADCAGGKPSYRDLHPDWAVQSCTLARDRILYEKTMVRGRGMDAVFTTVRVTYPADQRARWDSVAVATTRSMTPAPGR